MLKMEACKPRKWDTTSRKWQKGGAQKKRKKEGANVGRPLSRTPLLGVTERRTGLLGPPCLPHRLPTNPKPDSSFHPTIGHGLRGNSPREPEVRHQVTLY